MGRKPKKILDASISPSKLPLRPSVRFRLAKSDTFFGPGVAEFLTLVDQSNSMQTACKEMEMSYSKGWKIIKKAEEVQADIICVSAMLTTTMPQIQGLIKLLENKKLRDKYCVMIGGAPVTGRYASRIGADIYTADAASAAKEARKIITEKKRKSE